MFDRAYIRYIIAVVWIIAFVALWSVFNYAIASGGQAMLTNLDNLEQSITAKNWTQASHYMQKLKKNWQGANLVVQSNNATPTINNFERSLSMLETTVKHKKDTALEYIGELRQILTSITTVFPEP